MEPRQSPLIEVHRFGAPAAAASTRRRVWVLLARVEVETGAPDYQALLPGASVCDLTTLRTQPPRLSCWIASPEHQRAQASARTRLTSLRRLTLFFSVD